MKYDYKLIHFDDMLSSESGMYSFILLSARKISFTLNGTACFLGGKYILCLSNDDNIADVSGDYQAYSLRFLPYFINVNLSHEIINLPVYESMRAKHRYPDFHLFCKRDKSFFGIVPLNDSEYDTAKLYFSRIDRYIKANQTDDMWSCKARSDMFSILNISESAYCGTESREGSEIIRWIKDNAGKGLTLTSLSEQFHISRTTLSRIIKELTGMAPMAYVLEERLTQVLPDLLFTNVPINALSEKYGFADDNYFIRAFKKKYRRSPLQYRKKGCGERIKSQKLYGGKTPDAMFADYYYKGLGRALTFLKEQNDKDKAPYRKILVDHITGVREPDFRRVIGEYEKRLIDCFDDREALSEEIAEKLLPKITEKDHISSIPLMISLGHGGEVREKIEQLYKSSYAELIEFTKSGVSDEKYPPCSVKYFSAVYALGGEYLKSKPDRIKQILLDIANLFNYSDSPVIPTYQNPLYRMMDGMDRDVFYSLLDEVSSEHPHGKNIDIRKEFFTISMSDIKPDPDITADKILNSNSHALFVSFAVAPESVISSVAKMILSDIYDAERRLYMMGFFTDLPWYDDNIPRFPLDPTLVIEWAERETEKAVQNADASKNAVGSLHEAGIISRAEYESIETAHRLFYFLSFIRHPAVRAYAEKILNDEKSASVIRRYAIKMLYGSNYTPYDKQALTALLASADPAERDSAFVAVIQNVKLRTPDFPEELYGIVFAESDPNTRFELIIALSKSGSIPESIREECLFDSEKQIRDIAASQK